MVMENEACNFDDSNNVEETNTTFKFLEAHISVNKNKMQISHNNKNETAITKTGTQKHFRYHHHDSYAPKNQKIGAIIESIVRMSRYTDNPKDMDKSIHLLRQELSLLKYPAKYITLALKKIKNKQTRSLGPHED